MDLRWIPDAATHRFADRVKRPKKKDFTLNSTNNTHIVVTNDLCQRLLCFTKVGIKDDNSVENVELYGRFVADNVV